MYLTLGARARRMVGGGVDGSMSLIRYGRLRWWPADDGSGRGPRPWPLGERKPFCPMAMLATPSNGIPPSPLPLSPSRPHLSIARLQTLHIAHCTLLAGDCLQRTAPLHPDAALALRSAARSCPPSTAVTALFRGGTMIDLSHSLPLSLPLSPSLS